MHSGQKRTALLALHATNSDLALINALDCFRSRTEKLSCSTVIDSSSVVSDDPSVMRRVGRLIYHIMIQQKPPSHLGTLMHPINQWVDQASNLHLGARYSFNATCVERDVGYH